MTAEPPHQRHIAVVGTGYVGLASAVMWAELGHDVVGLDIDPEKVAALNGGVSPIYEPGIDRLLPAHVATGRLRFTTDPAAALRAAHVVFMCVGTPPLPSGDADLRQVTAAAAAIGRHLSPEYRTLVVNKSTMPVGSTELVGAIIAENASPGASFIVLSNPEFLREGAALHDAMQPDRVVIGADDPGAAAELATLYAPLGRPVLLTDPRSAELAKYASNAFLATKISFINEMAELCERVGGDVTVVATAMGMDARIGPRYLHAGVGFGGSCLPKDVAALNSMAHRASVAMPVLDAVLAVNDRQRVRFVDRVESLLGGLEGRAVAIWGLAFKEGTDDLRDAPALEIIAALQARGVGVVRAYDPAAMGRAMSLLPSVELCEDVYQAATGADAVLVITPWREFAEADLRRVATLMRGDLVVDGRNHLDPQRVLAAGLRPVRIGRHLLDNDERHRPAWASGGFTLIAEAT